MPVQGVDILGGGSLSDAGGVFLGYQAARPATRPTESLILDAIPEPETRTGSATLNRHIGESSVGPIAPDITRLEAGMGRRWLLAGALM